MKKRTIRSPFFILLLINAFLSVVFIAGIAVSHRKTTPETRETFFLTPGNLTNVHFIKIIEKNAHECPVVLLSDDSDFWTGTSSASSEEIWPVNSESLKALFNVFSKPVKIIKAAENISSFENLELTDENAAVIVFSDTNKKELLHLYFGKTDELTNRIYLRTSKDNTVWTVQDLYSIFLSADPSFWSDPHLFPDFLFEKNKEALKNQSSLRRGKIAGSNSVSNLKPEYTLSKIIPVTQNKIVFKIYKTRELYTVHPEFVLHNSETEKTFSKLNYCYTVSQVTLENLIGETDGF